MLRLLGIQRLTISEQNLQSFLAHVAKQAPLQESLRAATNLDQVVAIASQAGFGISAEELQNAQVELSEEELEGVSGGSLYFVASMPI